MEALKKNWDDTESEVENDTNGDSKHDSEAHEEAGEDHENREKARTMTLRNITYRKEQMIVCMWIP